MFARRSAAKEQAQRDAEWRSLVRAISDPDCVVSESDEVRFRGYLCGTAQNGPMPTEDHLRPGRRERLTGPRLEPPAREAGEAREHVEDLTDQAQHG